MIWNNVSKTIGTLPIRTYSVYIPSRHKAYESHEVHMDNDVDRFILPRLFGEDDELHRSLHKITRREPRRVTRLDLQVVLSYTKAGSRGNPPFVDELRRRTSCRERWRRRFRHLDMFNTLSS